jgi:hypothetical protein
MDGLGVLPHWGHSCRTKFSLVINIDQPRAGALGKIGYIAVRQTVIGDREIGNALPPNAVEASCPHPHNP